MAHEDSEFMGFGAEVAAIIAAEAFEYLDAPVRRVAGLESAIPHAISLENEVLPQTENIADSLRSLLAY